MISEKEPLDVKIGQMIMVGFRGLTVDDGSPVVEDIAKGKIGGVILFDYDVPSKSPVRNIESPEQVRSLVKALQSAAAIPLFIAIDQEGGRVSRLKEQFGFPPTVTTASSTATKLVYWVMMRWASATSTILSLISGFGLPCWTPIQS